MNYSTNIKTVRYEHEDYLVDMAKDLIADSCFDKIGMEFSKGNYYFCTKNQKETTSFVEWIKTQLQNKKTIHILGKDLSVETANIDSLADVFMSYLDADSLIIEGMDYLKRSIIGEACCIELIRHYINNEKLTIITSFDYPWESRLLKSLCKDFRLFYTSMEGALCEYVGGEFDELLIQ